MQVHRIIIWWCVLILSSSIPSAGSRQLAEDNKLDRPSSQNNGIITLSEHIQYQQSLFDKFNSSWSHSGCIYQNTDVQLYKQWQKEMQDNEQQNITRLGFVLVPVRWSCIGEAKMRRQHNVEYMRNALVMFAERKRKFHHILLFHQHSIDIVFHSDVSTPEIMSLTKQVLEPDVIIFSTRMNELIWKQNRLDVLPSNAISVPLLPAEEIKYNSDIYRKPVIYFQGACTHPIRKNLYRTLDSLNYLNGYFQDIAKCGKRVSKHNYKLRVRSHTWVLTPRGSYPASYHVAEAIQAGSIPIYMYSSLQSVIDQKTYFLPYGIEKEPASFPVTPKEILKAMPYADILDWSKFSFILSDLESIKDLPGILAHSDTRSMQREVKEVRYWFTIPGLIHYMKLRIQQHVDG